MWLALLVFHCEGEREKGREKERRDGWEGRVKHVVVLMLENRSFDHALGFLKTNNTEVDGLWGNETNPYDPQVGLLLLLLCC